MRAMLGLEVALMMGFTSGGRSGLSPSPGSDNFSSLGFVSLIFFLSAGDDRAEEFSLTTQSRFYSEEKVSEHLMFKQMQMFSEKFHLQFMNTLQDLNPWAHM